METLYVFIIRNDIWIYFLCGLGLVWYFVELIRARRTLRGAIYGLERERGQRMQNRALILVLFFIAIIAFVVFVNLQIAPTLPEEILRPPTPTPGALSIPTPSEITDNEAGTVEPFPTQTLAIAPTVTLPSDLAEGRAAGESVEEEDDLPDVVVGECSNGIAITAPPSGVIVSGQVTVFGTATSEDFSYYDLEIYGPATSGLWISVYEVLQRQPVIDDVLVSLDFEGFDPGSYFLRLSVIGTEGTEAGSCVIQLEV